MSRESRLAKRDVKLQKLAAKRGVERLKPQKRSTGDVIHLARAHYIGQAVTKKNIANAAEMKRAFDKVLNETPPQLEGTPQEQRAQYEATLLAVTQEAKLVGFDGKRIDVTVRDLTEHLAYQEYMKREQLR